MKIPFATLALAFCATAHAQSSTLPSAPAAPFKVAPRVPLKAQPFSLTRVRLLDGPFKRAQDLDHKYLLFLDPDRFLHGFHKNAGLPTKAPIYGGWESQGVAGQTMGHYMSALALMFQATGDAELKRRLDYMVDEVIRVQDANGNGYAAAIPDGKAMFADVKAGKGNGVHRGWVPWYTMHKLFAGLRDAHVLTQNPKALASLIRLSDWAVDTTANLSDEQWDVVLTQEHGGMAEVLADVYALTGEQKYLDVARHFSHRLVLEPASQEKDNLNGLHANTQIPKFLGFERIAELSGDAKHGRAASYFWDNVVNQRTYAIGGNSNHEHFFAPDKTRQSLTWETAETCNTYNMLKLTRSLWMHDASAARYEYFERALFNQILGSQDPESNGRGHFNYLNPLKTGAFRTYSHPTDAGWCCVGSGVENHAKYGDAIYFHDAASSTLWVNLFIASELKWAEKGVTLRQETRFPESDAVRFVVRASRPTKFALNLRHPGWARGMSVSINGRAQKVASKPVGYEVLARTWRDGDVVTVRLPMSLSTEPLHAAPEMRAVLFGPIVLAGNLGREGMEKVQEVTTSQTQHSNSPVPPAPIFVAPASASATSDAAASANALLKSVRRVPGQPLRFEARLTDAASGAPKVVPMLPFAEAHHIRYGVYWRVADQKQWRAEREAVAREEAAQRALALRTLDEFRPGEQQNEKDHNLQSQNSNSGEASGKRWRDAQSGGFFAFDLKVQPANPNTLLVTYWGGERDARAFDILLDGQKVAEQSLQMDKPEAFFDKEYALPEELTRGKEKVTIRFQPRPGNTAGGVFGARTLRR